MRRVPFLLASLILSACLTSVRAKAPLASNCTDYGKGRPLRVCTQLDESALRGRGRSTTWRVWVEGDGTPIQVRLHNNSPGVVRLKGGPDQIVHMGCRRHHEVRRKVIAVGTGEAKLEARPYSDSPKQEAAAIAAALAPRLAQIEAEFRDRRAKLPPDYPVKAVSELLNTTEAELLDALSYQELAALRDYVREQFRQARKDLETSHAKDETGDLPFHPRAVLASISLPLPLEEMSSADTPPAKAKTTAEAVLEYIGQMLSRLTRMADKNDLVTSLCVTSEPGIKAKFLMRPQSIKGWSFEALTIGNLAVVYRGLYAYSMSKGFRKNHCEKPAEQECALIDLVDDTQPIFHCDLASDACTRRPGPLPPACKNHGR